MTDEVYTAKSDTLIQQIILVTHVPFLESYFNFVADNHYNSLSLCILSVWIM